MKEVVEVGSKEVEELAPSDDVHQYMLDQEVEVEVVEVKEGEVDVEDVLGS